MIYLYLKTHNKTGLKYLGKTISNDPYAYRGSGKYWTRHIEKHGYDVTTEILLETDSEEELKKTGIYYSKLWNIIDSKEFANIIMESGDGGAMPWTEESREKVSKALSGRTIENTENMKKAQQKRAREISEFMKERLSDSQVYEKHCAQLRKNYDPEKVSASISSSKWYNNGKESIRSINRPDETWVDGRLPYKLSTVTCPHCGKEGGSAAMKRWHFNKCKMRKELFTSAEE